MDHILCVDDVKFLEVYQHKNHLQQNEILRNAPRVILSNFGIRMHFRRTENSYRFTWRNFQSGNGKISSFANKQSIHLWRFSNWLDAGARARVFCCRKVHFGCSVTEVAVHDIVWAYHTVSRFRWVLFVANFLVVRAELENQFVPASKHIKMSKDQAKNG